MSFIGNLQNKPRYVRVQILWISVVLVMVIIFSLWITCLKSSLDVSESNQEFQAQANEKSIPSLFGTLKEDLSLLRKNLQAGLEGLIRRSEGRPKFEIEIIKP